MFILFSCLHDTPDVTAKNDCLGERYWLVVFCPSSAIDRALSISAKDNVFDYLPELRIFYVRK